MIKFHRFTTRIKYEVVIPEITLSSVIYTLIALIRILLNPYLFQFTLLVKYLNFNI